MDILIIIGLAILGILFILLELFFLPGISVAMIGGVGCFVAAVVMAYKNIGPAAGNITLILCLLASIASIWWFFRSRALDKMALNSEIDSTVDPLQGLAVAVGDKGICLSRLAPSGKISIQGKVLEGRAENEMIDEGDEIEVIEVGTANVIVKRVNNN